MLKVGIIGCGKIADSHAEQLERIRSCEIAAVCDREGLMARQLFERYAVQDYFSDVETMLRKARPDVVHVCSPPDTHFDVGRLCLEHGCHVYMEKPFTINADEAEILIETAQSKGLKITVGHDSQFSHAARRMRKLVAEGYLGGRPVHTESYYGYDLGDLNYAKALMGGRNHWVRRLPGKLVQNVISHGLAQIAPFLSGDDVRVVTDGFVSDCLKQNGERELVDEVRAIIRDRGNTTAYFTFSTQMRPILHQLRVYGPRNGLVLDESEQCVVRLPGRELKSYLKKFVPPWHYIGDHAGNFGRNIRLFLRNDFHMKAGMKCLFESFYGAIEEGGAEPIPYREILLVSRILDEICRQIMRSDEERLEERSCEGGRRRRNEPRFQGV